MANEVSPHAMTTPSPEKRLLTGLFLAQRHLRFVRGVSSGLRWFAVGAGLASLGLILLWNWDRLPGPWQWAATAGRPRELLWLPLLLALGGFASHWLAFPSLRETAHRVDRLRDSQERLLTAIDWILTEKPRTLLSERLLQRAAEELSDETRLRSDLRRLEKVPAQNFRFLATLLIPVLLLWNLPPHVGLPDSASVWIGTPQVDRLAEELARELQENQPLKNPESQLKDLLRKIESQSQPDGDPKLAEAARRELQRTSDQLRALGKGQEATRELLETLAQRARQGQELSEQDRKALQELRKMLNQPDQTDALKRAESEWQKNQNEQAAQELERLQQEAGQAAQELKELAAEGQAHGEKSPQESQESQTGPGQGQDFDETQGDQHPGQGDQGEGKEGSSAGEGREGEGQGEPGEADFGTGTTEEEQAGQQANGLRSRRQSKRTSDRTEEFKNLHAPVRSKLETTQTRVKGELDRDGPRQRSSKEGRGQATEPAKSESGGALLHYQESAENALLREEIPAVHRDEVRQYFETLDK